MMCRMIHRNEARWLVQTYRSMVWMIRNRWVRMHQAAFMPCDASSLAVFRMALGLSISWFAWDTLASPSLNHDYIKPAIHLTFYGFDWVRPWPGHWMTLHFIVLLIASAGFTLGLCYRMSAIVMWFAFTHVFLIERTLYNNHYYLTSLLAGLSIFLPMQRVWSLDVLRTEGSASQTAPMWTVWLLRFQLSVVYFFGGIAKLDADWLAGQPMRMWLTAKADKSLFEVVAHSEWLVLAFVWGGLLIDLLAAPGLLWRRTRFLTMCVLTVFHLINSQFFTIGFFPWLMMLANTIFFVPDWPRRLAGIPRFARSETVSASYDLSPRHRLGTAAVMVFVVIQLVLPFRHLAYPGNPSWTEQGQLFAWRMMLRQKTTAIRFFGHDPGTGRQGVLDVRPFLNPRQMAAMSRDPDLIVQFAQKLEEYHVRHGVPRLEIRVKAYVSLNGRKPQLLIDPAVDLTQVSRGERCASWILPLTEPLRHNAWDVPIDQWEKQIAPPQQSVSVPLQRNTP